jgi:UDP-2,3-diacylglucosamine pyrophosphatase LpxH
LPVWFDNIQKFDELYSVSDLHMGGFGSGAQIFKSGPELAKLIEHLQTKPGTVALVINGDIVDFLAEPGAKAFDPEGAVQKLTRIAEDTAFAPVWQALRSFVGTEGHRLIITLGNHDLELALPWVREHLLYLLAGNDDAARGRIITAFDGAGFLCRVGNATVLCVHGNEVDDWNLTDHEALRRLGRDMQQGHIVGPWVPNAGSHLVINLMNNIKERYPFVDLIQPWKVVFPILRTFTSIDRQQIKRAVQTAQRLVQDKLRRKTGLLGEGKDQAGIAVPAEAEVSGRPPMDHDALLEAAELQLVQNVEPISLVSDEERVQQLGWPEAVAHWVSGAETLEILRAKFEELIVDRSFDWWGTDDPFRKIDDKIASNVDFILTGHTHLERSLQRRGKTGHYLNSGTWIRLIQLKPDVLANPVEFKKVYDALAGGGMDRLDGFDGLILHRHTVAAVKADDTGTKGELLRWEKHDDTFQLKTIASSDMTKP